MAQIDKFDNFKRAEYPDSLKRLVNIIISERIPNDSLLYYCFPSDSAEAILLFEQIIKKKKKYHGVYYQINRYWINKCIVKYEKFIYRFIRFSEFVDGYFATDYFMDIESIINKIDVKFCNILNKSPYAYKRRLLLDENIIKKCKLKKE